MNNPTQHRSRIFGISRRVAGATLALAVALVAAVVMTGSAQAQTYSQLYSFTGPPDGASPVPRLLQDAQGNLYGTTGYGGDSVCGLAGGCGTVFKLDTSGKETVLYRFTGGADGAIPLSGVVQDAQGNLYGGTFIQGVYGYGTVFKLDTSGKETVLYSFGGLDGARPGYLVLDTEGNLYGTTKYGGPFGRGTVFKLDTTGKETVLCDFVKAKDGVGPSGPFVRDAQGNLYGTTSAGGALHGVVFKVDTTGKETVLYTFLGKLYGDGAGPQGVAQDAQGNLYGITGGGGAYSYGTVFKVDTTGKETVLHSFTGGADGKHPMSFVLDSQGNLFCTTYKGGAHNHGTIFEVDATGKETVIYNFTGTEGYGGLGLDAQGILYGATSGGAYGYGTVFKLTP